MATPQIQDLLEAGVHFGHQTSRWNPKMRKFIFAERNGIYIIDLKKTQRQIELAQELVRQVISRGERVLFVCTKKQLRPVIQSEAERSNSFYVTERWLGGMLTNFTTIKKQIRRLRELERGQEEGAFDFYTKKERLMLDREREKLEKYLAGVKDMARAAGRGLRGRREEGADRGQRGQQAGHPGDRDRRHQRGPRPAHRADRGQRRRDPLGERDHRRRSRTRSSRRAPRCRPTSGGAPTRRRRPPTRRETGETTPADEDDRAVRSGARAASGARSRR